MDNKDLIKFCRYYHGEKSNPYKDDAKCIFWDCEKQYLENNKRNPDFRKGWHEQVDRYIHDNPGANNDLTSNNISIETKAIILFIESMLMKWYPYDVDIIFKY